MHYRAVSVIVTVFIWGPYKLIQQKKGDNFFLLALTCKSLLKPFSPQIDYLIVYVLFYFEWLRELSMFRFKALTVCGVMFWAFTN